MDAAREGRRQARGGAELHLRDRRAYAVDEEMPGSERHARAALADPAFAR